MTAESLKSSAAVGRAKRAKTTPVSSATPRMPMMDSTVITQFAATLAG